MVDKTNLDELQKTDIYGFTLLDDEHVLDIKRVSENFKEVEKILGNKGELGAESNQTFTDMIKKNSDDISNVLDIDLKDYSIEVNGKKSLSNYIKYIWDKLVNIELTDLKINVTTWLDETRSSLTLDKVLGKIKGWIGALTNLKTKEKSSLVGAVNELVDNTENLKQAELLDRQDIVKIKSELTGEDEALKLNNEKFAQLLGVNIEDIRGGVNQ